MTSVRRKDDLNVDLEQQFILRLPLKTADKLRRDLNEAQMKDKFSVEIHPEKRRGKVIYDAQMYHAKLVDLPCIIESYKTIDKKNFHKSADISQMLVCKDELGVESPEEGDEKKQKKYMCNHGLCPPLKNVRKRRFRKTLQKKNAELPDIERELRRLFSMDAQATSFKYELIYDSDTNAKNTTATPTTPSKDKKGGKGSKSSINVNDADKIEKRAEATTMDHQTTQPSSAHNTYNPIEIFGDCSSSEDEMSDTEIRVDKKGEGFKDVNQGGLDDDDSLSRNAIADGGSES